MKIKKKFDLRQILIAVCILIIIVMNVSAIPNLLVGLVEKYIIHRESVDASWLIKDIRQQTDLIFGFIAFWLAYMTGEQKKLSDSVKTDVSGGLVTIVNNEKNRQYAKFLSYFVIYMFIVSNLSVWTSDISMYTGYRSTWNYEDYTASVHTGYGTFYGTNYPPLAILFYKLLHVPLSGLDVDVRMYYMNYVVYMYTMVCGIFMVSMMGLFLNESKSFDMKRSLKQAGILMLSGPVLFSMERGNIILIGLLFTLAFLSLKDSEDNKKSHLSALMLALAANMKFYPAVFGLCYIKEKKWKEAIWSAAYGVFLFLFLLPFQNSPLSVMAAELSPTALVSDSIHSTGMIESVSGTIPSTGMIESVSGTMPSTGIIASGSAISGILGGIKILTAYVSEDVGGLSMKSIIQTAFSVLGISMEGMGFNIVFMIALVLCIIVSIYCFFITERKDHELAMLSFLCILVPSVSAWYSILFMILPLLVLLKNADTMKKNILTDIEIGLYAISFIYAEFNGLYVGPGYNWYFVLLYLVIVVQIFREKAAKG